MARLGLAGSGRSRAFPSPRWTRTLAERRVGVHVALALALFAVVPDWGRAAETAQLDAMVEGMDYLLAEAPPPSRIRPAFDGAVPVAPPPAEHPGRRKKGAATVADTLADAPIRPAYDGPPDAPGRRIADHAAAFAAAQAHVDAARALASRDTTRITDAEIARLTEAILIFEEIAAAAKQGQAFEAAWNRAALCEYRLGRWWAAFSAVEKSFPAEMDVIRVTARVSLQSMIADALYAYGHRRVPGGWDGQRGVDAPVGFRAARDAYRAVVVNDRAHPRAARALVRYGLCSLELGDLDGAEQAFRQAATDYARGDAVFEARVRLAETLLRKHRHAAETPPAVDAEIEALLAAAGYDQQEIDRFRGTPERGVPLPLTATALARLETGAREQARAMDAALTASPAFDPKAGLNGGRVGASKPGVSTEALVRAVADRDEADAARLLKQAQYFLSRKDKTSRASARFMLDDLNARFPDTPSAEVGRTLIARFFSP